MIVHNSIIASGLLLSLPGASPALPRPSGWGLLKWRQGFGSRKCCSTCMTTLCGSHAGLVKAVGRSCSTSLASLAQPVSPLVCLPFLLLLGLRLAACTVLQACCATSAGRGQDGAGTVEAAPSVCCCVSLGP